MGEFFTLAKRIRRPVETHPEWSLWNPDLLGAGAFHGRWVGPGARRKENLTLFLTLEDPNAKIKGSRDPLGVQPIWATFGRHVVTNLTMQTNSIRGFTILLLARYLTERLIEEGRLGRESALDAFLRFEQAGAYVRHLAHEVHSDIRGIERVRSRVGETPKKVPISASPDGYILIDQKVNGLWGLFSVSARVSGLIPDGPVGLEPETRRFLERAYGPHLRPVMDRLLHLVLNDGRLDTNTSDAMFVALSRSLSESFTTEEQEFFGEHLRDGLHVRHDGANQRGQQKKFRELLVDHTEPNTAIGREDMIRLNEAACSVDRGLARSLDRIVRLEAVVAPAMSLFEFVLSRHGRERGDVAEELASRWGDSVPNIDPARNSDLLAQVGTVSSEAVETCLDRCQLAFSRGNYEDAIDALLAWHDDVMRGRGGAAWVRTAEGGKLDVRYRGVEQTLPSGDELPTLWRNGYFVPPLKAIIGQLEKSA